MKVKYYHFPSIDSTNDWAKQHIDSFKEDEIVIITADFQKKGRGTGKRTWHSPAKVGLYVTFCFFLQKKNFLPKHYAFLLSISIIHVLCKLNFDPFIKWPNDISLSGKKIGGTLTEAKWLGKKQCLILGFGLNVNMETKDLASIPQPSTSLKIEKKQSFSIPQLFTKIKEQFIEDIDKLHKQGISSFYIDYQQYIDPKFEKELFISSL